MPSLFRKGSLRFGPDAAEPPRWQALGRRGL